MAKFKISKFTIFISTVALILAAGGIYYINSRVPSAPIYQQPKNNSTQTIGNLSTSTDSQSKSHQSQSSTLNLPIPFTPQAPTANWDELHNEACEEVSGIMANAYLTGGKDITIPADQVESQISSLTTWQDQNFGYHLNTTAAETVQMIQGFYGLKAKAVQGYSLQDIKDQINLHNVVILPVNGRLIGNPNYRQPGPIYHMLVIRGYTAAGLITNDSGTRRGQNYPYTFDTLHNAGVDWDHSTNTINSSKKVMIVVWK